MSTQPATTPADSNPTSRSPDIPEQLGKYRIVRKLGTGGMGEVWLGADEFGNKVAIKLISPDGFSQERHVKRFLRESEALAMLQHRCLCRIYGVEEYNGKPYIIMEYEQGVSLSSLLSFLASGTIAGHDTSPNKTPPDNISEIIIKAEKAAENDGGPPPPRQVTAGPPKAVLPLQQTLSIIIDLCGAVQYAHERGILHRDIKPGNIIIRHDGSPVLLDFGLAKLARRPADPSLTQTGQFFGTVEYASPEQARSSRDVDERADVYSIGVIMYELLTGRKFFATSGNIVVDLKKIEDYDLTLVRRRMAHIDRDLQLIILKATAADTGRRYRSAKQLLDDLKRYRDGQPVLAAPPSLLYGVRRFVRRHTLAVALSSVTILLTLALAGYVSWDYYRKWGQWVRIFSQEFKGVSYEASQYTFTGSDGLPLRPWSVDSLGLEMRPQEWCWLRDVAVAGNVRVVLTLRFDDVPDGIEIAVNSAADTIPEFNWYFVPRGYSCQVGGYLGTMDFISVNKTADIAHYTSPVPVRMRPDRTMQVIFQRVDDNISLIVNGRREAQATDMVPFYGPEFCRIGLRTYAASVHVDAVSVYRMSLPQKASPLIAGDALASAGADHAAAQTYLSIAQDYRNRIGEQALMRAGAMAYSLSDTLKRVLLDSVFTILHAGPARATAWQTLQELRILDLWKNGQGTEAVRLLPGHYREFPGSAVAVEMMNVITAGQRPPDPAMTELFRWMLRSRGATCLRTDYVPREGLELLRNAPITHLSLVYSAATTLSMLSGTRLSWLTATAIAAAELMPLQRLPLRYLDIAMDTGVTSLRPLQSCPLEILNAAGCRLDSLPPLAGRPLRLLSVDYNRISDLSPLRGSKLRYLSIVGNRVSDLSPLAGLPLRSLDCSSNPLKTLEPLRGSHLKRLVCRSAGVADLSPLAASELWHLDIRNNAVASLAPLAGVRLRSLLCSGNSISDIAALAGLPLRRLDISGNAIASLEPLRSAEIEDLSCRNNRIGDLSPVAGLPLTRLDCGGNPVSDLSALRGMPLCELRISGAQVSNLAALRGSRLYLLAADTNRIADLQPLSQLPLRYLSVSGNRIASLDPLRRMHLDTLRCEDNGITSLEPLRGMHLHELFCEGNQLKTLSPFETDPPPLFRFYCPSIPDSVYERFAAGWEKIPRLRSVAHAARVYARLGRRDMAGLHSMAVNLQGHSYLYIPLRSSWAEADSASRSMGGHLVSVTSAAEDSAVAGLPGADDLAWTGLRLADAEPHWVTGEPFTEVIRPQMRPAGTHYFIVRGRYIPTRPTDRLGYIVEWDR